MMQSLIPNLEKYYIKSIKTLLWTSALSFFIGIWMGLITTELRMTIEYDQSGTYLQSTIHLSLLHGHIFMLGGVTPVIMCVLLVFGKLIGGKNIPKKFLPKTIFMYICEFIMTLVILLAKGIRIFDLAKQELPNPDFNIIEEQWTVSDMVKICIKYIYLRFTISFITHSWNMFIYVFRLLFYSKCLMSF